MKHPVDPLDRAFSLLNQQRPDEAARIFRRYARSKVPLQALESCRALGDHARMSGRYPPARQWLTRALTLSRKLGDPLQLAQSLNSLGILCKYEAKFPEGLRHYRAALKLALRLENPEPDFVATLYHNLGGLEFSRGRYRAAEPHARRSVTLRKKCVGPGYATHPALLADLAALAPILDEVGKKREAEKIYREVLPRFRRLGTAYAYDVATNEGNLAALLLDRGRVGEARTFFRRAIRGLRRIYGPEHPEVSLMLHNLGMLERRAGRSREARKLLTEALSGLKRQLGAGHPSTRVCVEALSSLVSRSP